MVMQKRKKVGVQEIWHHPAELASDHSFLIWNKQCFLQFPAKIRATFLRHAYGLADDDEPHTLPSPQFAQEVLDTKTKFWGMQDLLHQAFELRKEHAIADYLDFVKWITKVSPAIRLTSFQLAPNIPIAMNH
jgi:hypothetical protein